MFLSLRSARRPRLAFVWAALLAFLATPSLVAADECERLTSNGTTRDCTFLEEARECVDNANHSLDDCHEDAASKSGWFSKSVNFVGCEAAFMVNIAACGVSVAAEWALGGTF
jgi:hypothetical protein